MPTETIAHKPGVMDLCVCRSCGDLAPDAIKEIDRLRAALTEIMRGKGEARAWVIANEALKNV